MPTRNSSPKIVAVTGAAGRIGYSLIPLICDGSIFGKDQRIILRLIDMDMAMSRLIGLKVNDTSTYIRIVIILT